MLLLLLLLLLNLIVLSKKKHDYNSFCIDKMVYLKYNHVILLFITIAIACI